MSVHIVANRVHSIRRDGDPGSSEVEKAIIAQMLLQWHLTIDVNSFGFELRLQILFMKRTLDARAAKLAKLWSGIITA